MFRRISATDNSIEFEFEVDKMNIQVFSKEEMIAEREKEKGFPIVSKWFRRKGTEQYQKQIDIFHMNDFEEVR